MLLTNEEIRQELMLRILGNALGNAEGLGRAENKDLIIAGRSAAEISDHLVEGVIQYISRK